jgi:hypothetical protein
LRCPNPWRASLEIDAREARRSLIRRNREGAEAVLVIEIFD